MAIISFLFSSEVRLPCVHACAAENAGSVPCTDPPADTIAGVQTAAGKETFSGVRTFGADASGPEISPGAGTFGADASGPETAPGVSICAAETAGAPDVPAAGTGMDLPDDVMTVSCALGTAETTIDAAAIVILAAIALEDIRTMRISDKKNIALLALAAAAAVITCLLVEPGILAGAGREVSTGEIPGAPVIRQMAAAGLLRAGPVRLCGFSMGGGDPCLFVMPADRLAGAVVISGFMILMNLFAKALSIAGKKTWEYTAGGDDKEDDRCAPGRSDVCFGGGDIFMCFSAGALTGTAAMIEAAAAAMLLSGVFAAAALILRRLEGYSRFAFGPFLSFGIGLELILN